MDLSIDIRSTLNVTLRCRSASSRRHFYSSHFFPRVQEPAAIRPSGFASSRRLSKMCFSIQLLAIGWALNFIKFFYITAQRDGHAELVSASHCEPLLTPFPRWDPETSSGWLWEVLVISTLILGKPIQYLWKTASLLLGWRCVQPLVNRCERDVFSGNL